MQKAIFTIIAVFIFSFVSSAQENYLKRVPELQKTARLANGGALGCGEGTIFLVTSNGEISLNTGLDPIHVFGNKVIVADLIKLLEARAESNKTGVKNQMSGKLDDLFYVIFGLLRDSKDAAIIPVVSELLNDTDDLIRDLALMTLINFAESDKKLLETIKQIEFPSLAVQSAKNKGLVKPDWLKIKETN